MHSPPTLIPLIARRRPQEQRLSLIIKDPMKYKLNNNIQRFSNLGAPHVFSLSIQITVSQH